MTDETAATVAELDAELAEARAGLAAAEKEREAASRAARENPQDEDTITRVTKATYRLDAFRGRVADLEVEREEAGRADRRARAVERLSKGIPRAHGSLMNEYQKDMERVVSSVQALKKAVDRINSRYGVLDLLRLEAEAVADRFELPRLPLPLVLPPSRLPHAKEVVEEMARIVLTERSYPTAREIGRRVRGTPGGQLIYEAGPIEAERRATEAKVAKAEQDRREAEATMAPLAGAFKAANAPTRHGLGF